MCAPEPPPRALSELFVEDRTQREGAQRMQTEIAASSDAQAGLQEPPALPAEPSV